MSIESPEYKLILIEKPFEIRQYAPFITAEVRVNAADYDDAANRGFRPLANFIFGNNIAKQKISMTAPVTAAPSPEKIAMTAPVTVSGEDVYTVAFTMPRKYSLKSLPEPVDKSISFKENPEKTMAVIRFSGSFNQKNFVKRIAQLHDWIEIKGFKEVGDPLIAGYDPPFTPWFLKHNEVMIEIKK
jgi:hypothetical protein